MSDKIRDIKRFIWQHIDESHGGQVVKCDEFYDLEDLIAYTNKKFDCEIECTYVGGFESPGYDADCWAWAGIIDGELYFDSLEQESY